MSGLQAKAAASEPAIVDLQRLVGNQATESLLRLAEDVRASEGAATRQSVLPNGNGQPLEPDIRASMEERFGEDFGHVRVHIDDDGAIAAESEQARAFTLGTHVVFAAGEYRPRTAGGRQLLAHELAHVVQQTRGIALGVSDRPGTAAEQDANRAASAATSGTLATVGTTTGLGVARQPSVAPFPEHPVFLVEDPHLRRNWENAAKEVLGREFGRKFSSFAEAQDHFKTHLQSLASDTERQDFADRMRDRVRKAFWRKEAKTPSFKYTDEQKKRLKGGAAPREDVELEHLEEVKKKNRPSGKHIKAVPGHPERALDPGNIYTTSKPHHKEKWHRYEAGIESSRRVRQKRQEGAKGSPSKTGQGTSKTPAKRKKTTVRPSPSKTTSTKPSRRPRKTRATIDEPPATAVKGSLRGLGLQFGSGLLWDEFQEMMLGDLEKLPKPKVDVRGTQQYLNDPDVASSMKLIDLFNKELGPFRTQLQEHHDSVRVNAAGEALIAGSHPDMEKRLERLGAIQDQLSDYGDDLETISDNLDALLALEENALESADAADALVEFMYEPLVSNYLVESFGVEGFSRAETALRYHAAAVRKLFRDARKLRKSLDKLMEERDTMATTIGGFQREAFQTLVAQRTAQQKQARQRAALRKPRHKVAIEPKERGTPTPSLWEHGTRVLRRARTLRQEPNAPESDTRAALDDLYAVLGAIENRLQYGSPHEEEKDALRRLKGELLREVGAYLDAKSRGEQ